MTTIVGQFITTEAADAPKINIYSEAQPDVIRVQYMVRSESAVISWKDPRAATI